MHHNHPSTMTAQAVAIEKNSTSQYSLIRLLAVVLLGLSLLMLPLAQRAFAHDVLVDSSPEVGGTVETSPEEIRLEFSGQPLVGQGLTNLIQLTDADGNKWQNGEVTVDGYQLSVAVCPGLPQGEFRVSYRVIYSDGHTGEESFTFTNNDPSAPAAGTAPGSDCGEVTSGAAAQQSAEDSAPGEAEASDTAATAETENSAAGGLPTWMWIAGGVGVLIIIAVVIALLRGGGSDDDTKETTSA